MKISFIKTKFWVKIFFLTKHKNPCDFDILKRRKAFDPSYKHAQTSQASLHNMLTRLLLKQKDQVKKEQISSILVIPRMLLMIITMMLIHWKLNFNLWSFWKMEELDVKCKSATQKIERNLLY
jgi:hypothetical protein